MGIYLNPGNKGFMSALCSKIYVDKTGLLEYTNSVLDTEQRCLCVSRPRRFGKSIAAEMLVAYYDKSCHSAEMFQELKIARAKDFKKHLNQYYVIHVDMNVFRSKRDKRTGKQITTKQIVEIFQTEIIAELKKIFIDSVIEDEIDLPSVLAKIYEHTQEQFVIIIDEWDMIFREDKQNEEVQMTYLSLLRGLFKDAPSKKFIKLAYLTGILPIKKYGTESALNNFDEFTMLESDVLAEYTGFTEKEVYSLYQIYNMDFEKAQLWYDGYRLSENLHIYNPKSVIDSIRRKRIGNYWTSTETYESLKKYINMNYDGLKDQIILMLAGIHCKINPNKFKNDMISFSSKDDILTLLVHLGYLSYDMEKEEVFIPNEEVRGEFKNAVEESGWDYVIKAITASDDLLRATWRKDEDAVAKGIASIHMANTSILSYHDENSLSCVITLAYYNAVKEYTLIRELPTGKGYADIVFLPRKHSDKPAIIVELKWNKTAKGAIDQIKEKQYFKVFEGYNGKILLVGINYDKETKEHQCKIEQIMVT